MAPAGAARIPAPGRHDQPAALAAGAARPLAIAPHRHKDAPRRAVRRHCRDAAARSHPPCRPVAGERGGYRGGRPPLQGGDGAEPL